MKQKWKEPIRVGELLDRCFDDSVRPPISNGVYLISRKTWKGKPTQDCIPLYVGSNTVNTNRFRARIGDLIADMFGFFGERTSTAQKIGHHSGGQNLYSYCKDKRINPQNLYIGWLENCDCVRCEENKWHDKFKPCGKLRNVKRPSRCNKKHKK